MLHELFQNSLATVLILIALALALTIFVFRKRLFDRRGPRQAQPKDPVQIKRDNPPDEWSRSR